MKHPQPPDVILSLKADSMGRVRASPHSVFQIFLTIYTMLLKPEQNFCLPMYMKKVPKATF